MTEPSEADRQGLFQRLRDWWRSMPSDEPDAYDDEDDYLRWQR